MDLILIKIFVLTVDILLHDLFHCRQSASEKKKVLAKARLTKFREKLYSNPELLEEYRRKERERLGLEMLQV